MAVKYLYACSEQTTAKCIDIDFGQNLAFIIKLAVSVTGQHSHCRIVPHITGRPIIQRIVE